MLQDYVLQSQTLSYVEKHVCLFRYFFTSKLQRLLLKNQQNENEKKRKENLCAKPRHTSKYTMQPDDSPQPGVHMQQVIKNCWRRLGSGRGGTNRPLRDFDLQSRDNHGTLLAQVRLNDEDLILEAIKYDASALRFATDELQDNMDIVLAACLRNGNALDFASVDKQDNFDIVSAAISSDGLSLRFASANKKDNSVLVHAAVLQNGCALQYASDAIRANEEFMTSIVKHDGMLLQYASSDIRNNLDIVGAAVLQTGDALQFASDFIRGTKEFMMRVVERNGMLLQWAHETLKSDVDVVENAVRQNGLSLQYSNSALHVDINWVQCCVCQKWRMYDLDLTDAISNNSTWQCSDNTDANRQSCMIDQDTVDHREHSILLAAVQENGLALEYGSIAGKNDEVVVRSAISNNPQSFVFASDQMKNSRKIVKRAVEKIGLNLQFASEQMRDDHEIVKIAVLQNNYALEFGTASSQDKLIALLAVKIKGKVIGQATTSPFYNYNDIFTHPLRFVKESLRSDFHILAAALHFRVPWFKHMLVKHCLAPENKNNGPVEDSDGSEVKLAKKSRTTHSGSGRKLLPDELVCIILNFAADMPTGDARVLRFVENVDDKISQIFQEYSTDLNGRKYLFPYHGSRFYDSENHDSDVEEDIPGSQYHSSDDDRDDMTQCTGGCGKWIHVDDLAIVNFEVTDVCEICSTNYQSDEESDELESDEDDRNFIAPGGCDWD